MIIFVLIIIAGAITLVVIGSDKGWFKKDKKPTEIPMIELYIQANELDNEEKTLDADIDISYFDNNNFTVSQKGELRQDSFVPFLVPRDRILTLRCWNEDHYLVTVYKSISSQEIGVNKSKTSCTMAKIGELKVELFSGDLTNTLNIIQLNLTAVNGWYYKTSFCTAWTTGILDVVLENDLIVCDKGMWLNYTKYYAENKTFEWLPTDHYLCGDREEICEWIQIDKCRPPKIQPPFQYVGKVDTCIYTGKSLSPRESFIISLRVSTLDFKNRLDQLSLYFFDKDRRYNEQNGKWEWYSEKGGENIGNKEDTTFEIRFQ